MSPRFLALAVALFALLAGASQAQTAAVMYPSGNISATGYVQAGGVSATNGYFTGSVGIGTNSPSYPLDVSGTVRATAFIGNGAGLTGISSGVSVTTGASGSLVYRDAYGSLVASSGLSISSTTGSVGIGAGAPSWINNGLYATGTIWSQSALGIADGNYLGWGDSSSRIAGTTSGNTKYIAFTTSGTEAMRIVSSGYVGIGTTNPGYSLDVYSSTGIRSSFAGPAFIGVQTSSTTAGHYAIMRWANPTQVWSAGIQADQAALFQIVRDYRVGGVSPAFVIAQGSGYASNGSAGIGGILSPQTALDVSGTVKMRDGGEACDTSRLGAIKYASNAFYVCQNTANGWELLATTGASANIDRITSSSQAGVIANSTGYISLTTGGVSGTAYFTPASVLVNAGVSSTGPISGTTGYFSGAVTSSGGVAGTSGSFRDWLQIATGNTASLYWGADLKTRITGNANSSYISIVTSATEAMRIVSTGYVGIGTTSPSYPLDISGTAQATQFLNTSDRRLKQDIKPLTAGLEDLRKLRPVTFRWKARPSDGEKLGLIAQEVEQVIPQAVKTATDPSGTKAIDYNALVPLLIKAIQQQQEEIDTLKAQLKAANDNDARLKEDIEALRAAIMSRR